MGTLKSLQGSIYRINVNQNINGHYDADKDFVISVTDMFVVECLLEFFGMEDVNSQPTNNMPLEFNTTDEKRDWYFKVIGKTIGDQVFPTTSLGLTEETTEGILFYL